MCIDASRKEARQRVLDEIQGKFPLSPDPYGVLSARLGLSREVVMESVESLRADGSVRQICASLSSRHLGYYASLCALAVPGEEAEVDRIAGFVSAHPEITHNYLRNDTYNVWFTAITRDEDDLARLLAEIEAETGIHDILNLPSTALYKIRVDFGKGYGARNVQPAPPVQEDEEEDGDVLVDALDADEAHAQPDPFDADNPFDIALVRWAQEDSTSINPFADGAAFVARETGQDVDERQVIARLRTWKKAGILRRYGAMVQHRKLGYLFNGMTVWDVEPDFVDELGARFADLPFVSHCYARVRCDSWPYNLYGMIHAQSQQELDERVEEMKRICGLEPKVLVSSKEYKKALPVYFAR